MKTGYSSLAVEKYVIFEYRRFIFIEDMSGNESEGEDIGL